MFETCSKKPVLTCTKPINLINQIHSVYPIHKSRSLPFIGRATLSAMSFATILLTASVHIHASNYTQYEKQNASSNTFDPLYEQASTTASTTPASMSQSAEQPLSSETIAHLRSILMQAGIQAPIVAITHSLLPNMYEVTLAGIGVEPLHITANGKYVLQGIVRPNPSPKVSIPPIESTYQTQSGMPVSLALRQSMLKNMSYLKNIPADVSLYHTSVNDVIWGVTLDGKPFITDNSASVFTDGEISLIEDNQFKGLDAQFETNKNRYILSQLDQDELLIYPATTAERAVVYVATDINCPYCRELHKNMAAINAQGITVKIIGFPIYEGSSELMTKVWCESDKQARKHAFDIAMSGQPIPRNLQQCASSDDDPLYMNQSIGAGLAVIATPGIYSEEGMPYLTQFDMATFLAFLGLEER